MTATTSPHPHRRRLALALLCAALSVTAGCRSDQGPSERDPAVAEAEAREAVEGFYADYIAGSRLDAETGGIHNPLLDGGYRDDERLGAELVEQIDAIRGDDGDRGMQADPFLCAIQIPERADVSEVKLEGDSAVATLLLHFAGQSIPQRLTVTLGAGEASADGEVGWRLTAIACR